MTELPYRYPLIKVVPSCGDCGCTLQSHRYKNYDPKLSGANIVVCENRGCSCEITQDRLHAMDDAFNAAQRTEQSFGGCNHCGGDLSKCGDVSLSEQSEDRPNEFALRLVDALHKAWMGCDTESATNRRRMEEAFSRAFNRARNRAPKQAFDDSKMRELIAEWKEAAEYRFAESRKWTDGGNERIGLAYWEAGCEIERCAKSLEAVLNG